MNMFRWSLRQKANNVAVRSPGFGKLVSLTLPKAQTLAYARGGKAKKAIALNWQQGNARQERSSFETTRNRRKLNPVAHAGS